MSTLLPIITKITQAVKSEDRVHIELDGKYWVTLSKDKLLELKIYKGKEIDPEEKKCIETAASFQKALLKVMHFISIRPRSKQEIIRYIKKKELLDFSEELLVKLEDTGLVDDESFTRWYVDNRTSFGTHGSNKIKMELSKLGVTRNIIDEEIRKRKERIQKVVRKE
jgi:regulatory protein